MIVVLCVLALSSCACGKTHRHLLHGWVVEYHGESRDPVPDIFLPPAAPSIQQRFQPLSMADESGIFPGIHEGIDVSGRVADPVVAAADGIVTESHRSWAWENQVRIDHGSNENGYDGQTLYVHLDERLVTIGDRVRRGQQIGTVGITGMAAGDPLHLHFVVYVRPTGVASGRWSAANPHLYWSDGIGKVTCYQPERDYPFAPLRLTYPLPCRRPQGVQ